MSSGSLPVLDALPLISQIPLRSGSSPSVVAEMCSILLENISVLDPLVTSLSSYLNSSEDNNIRYVLRNQNILANSPFGMGRGLGSSQCVGGLARGRGRNLYLSLAQDRALFDLAIGTQISIKWILRAPATRSENA